MSKFTHEDYTQALKMLLPSGLVWNAERGTTQHDVLSSLAAFFQFVDKDAVSLLEQSFPATALSMLPEWEETLGLPDMCSISEIYSIRQRQEAIVARLVGRGDLSKSFYIRMARSIGYEITITEFRQARAGLSVCGDPLNGDNWPCVWRVNAPSTTIRYARAGIAYCGDPLRSWGNRVLECLIKRLAPAHTQVLFGYQI
ncbi:MAG: YmfQ family protein [Enterobacteriaceae bacterium]